MGKGTILGVIVGKEVVERIVTNWRMKGVNKNYENQVTGVNN